MSKLTLCKRCSVSKSTQSFSIKETTGIKYKCCDTCRIRSKLNYKKKEKLKEIKGFIICKTCMTNKTPTCFSINDKTNTKYKTCDDCRIESRERKIKRECLKIKNATLCKRCNSIKLKKFFSINPKTDNKFKMCDTCRFKKRVKEKKIIEKIKNKICNITYSDNKVRLHYYINGKRLEKRARYGIRKTKEEALKIVEDFKKTIII